MKEKGRERRILLPISLLGKLFFETTGGSGDESLLTDVKLLRFTYALVLRVHIF